jgi:hypothetical protein
LRGRKFSLRSMMIATALFAVFISLILYPFAQVKNRRAGVMALEAAGIPYDTDSDLKDIYERLDIPYLLEPVSTTRTVDDIAVWMRPLLGDEFPIYPDRAVRGVALYTDEDVEKVESLLLAFPNLEKITLLGPTGGLSGVTGEGLRFFAEHYPELESVRVTSIEKIPEDWGKSLRGVHCLSVDAYQTAAPAKVTDDQVRDITAVPGLRVLAFGGIDVNDQNITILGQPKQLVHLTLWNTNMTKAGYTALRRANPDLRLTFGPLHTSPERFMDFIGESGAPIRVVYNDQRDQWGRRLTPNRAKLEYFGDGSAMIDIDFPISIEIQAPDESDSAFIYKKLRSLRNYAKRMGLVETSVDESAFAATITFVKAPDQASQ